MNTILTQKHLNSEAKTEKQTQILPLTSSALFINFVCSGFVLDLKSDLITCTPILGGAEKIDTNILGKERRYIYKTANRKVMPGLCVFIPLRQNSQDSKPHYAT